MAKKKEHESFYQLVHDHKHWNYCCVVYEDSAPKDWIKICRSWGENVLISPYHDNDKQDDGTSKKPHYHVIILGSTSYDYKWAIRLFNSINGIYDNPDQACDDSKKEFHNKNFYDHNIVHNKTKAIRYLTHKDDADKAQYNDADVIVIGCIDYQALCMMESDKYKALSEIEDWCEDNQCYSYRFLSNYCRKNNFAWYKVLVDGGHNHIYRFMRSLEYDLKENPCLIHKSEKIE